MTKNILGRRLGNRQSTKTLRNKNNYLKNKRKIINENVISKNQTPKIAEEIEESLSDNILDLSLENKEATTLYMKYS